MNTLKEYWIQKENKNLPPEYLNDIKNININEWKEIIGSSDKSKSLIDDLYNGSFLLIKNVISTSFLDQLKKKLVKKEKETPSSFYKMIENCPNFHKNIDDNIDTKYSIKSTRHSFYFFRWNRDSIEIFNEFDEIWSDIKLISGLKKNAFNKNTPKDGIVDRLQVVKYPVNTGYIEPHQHNIHHQRLIISVYMSKQGIDYKNGGTYFLDKNKNKIYSETNIDVGDVGIFYASMIHGVDKVGIFNHQNIVDSGRWWIGLYSPESDQTVDRKTSNPVSI